MGLHPVLSRTLKRLEIGDSLVRRNPLHYASASRRFARLAAAALEERAAWAASALDRALRDASRTPYGRRIRGGASLADWPLLEPAAVRERPRDFMRPTWFSIRSSTGGTSGIPLPLLRSPRSVAVEQAALDGLLRAHGVEPRRARVAVLRGDDIKPLENREPPFWTSALGGRRRVFSSNHLNHETVASYVRALDEHRADFWWVYPTTLEALVRLTRETGLSPRVALILSSSEVLSPWCREAARESFGARVVDYYGQAERVAFASAGPDGSYRFLPGYAHVELIPRPQDGPLRYEIVGTSLWNEAMPLVRYRTGDLIGFDRELTDAELQEVTLGTRPFDGVIGRDGDILIAPDGTRLTGIDHFHRGIERIVRIQVLQSAPDRVEILVIPAPGFGERERHQLVANARRKLPMSMSLELRTVDALTRTALGKTPFVIRAVPPSRRPEDLSGA